MRIREDEIEIDFVLISKEHRNELQHEPVAAGAHKKKIREASK